MGAEVGVWAATVYGAWALFLSVGCVGFHLLLVGLFLRAWWRPSAPRWFPGVELVYGLVNPAVYLLVFQPALFRRWTPPWLPWLCWLGWVLYWGARLFGARWLGAVRDPRNAVRRLLAFILVLVGAVTVRDVVATALEALGLTSEGGVHLAAAGLGLLCLPLYALPLMVALRQLGATRDEERWARGDFFFTWLPRWTAPALLALVALAIGATLTRRSEAEARDLVLANRAVILSESRQRHLDPRLLAAIVEVTQREVSSSFDGALEEAVTGAWLTDPTSHVLLAEALDPSLGLAQVKANTAMTGLALVTLSDAGASPLGKDYRSVWSRSREVLTRVSSPPLSHVLRPPGDALPRKAEVVRALRTPGGNLVHAAFILDLLAAQWEAANPAWAIRARPDILATLFQLGFERSEPKADPRSNDFGRRVALAMEEPWLKQAFGTEALPAR